MRIPRARFRSRQLPGGEYEPAFSPDGTRIAFVWNGENEDNFDIYVKPVGSEALTRLTSNPAGEGSPTWSPDGRNIAFLRYQGKPGKSAIYTIPSRGGPEAKLAEVFRASTFSIANWIGRPTARR